MSKAQPIPVLHWPNFRRTMAVEAIGVVVFALLCAVCCDGLDSFAFAVVLALGPAIPWFLAGWLTFGLVFLVGLRPRLRFPSVRWAVLGWIRLMLALTMVADAIRNQGTTLRWAWASDAHFYGAVVLAIISSVVFTRLHRSVRAAGVSPSFVVPRNQAFAWVAVGEVSLIASLVLMGGGGTSQDWYDAAWIVGGVWLPIWLGFLMWVRRRDRAAQAITHVHFLFAACLRSWLGIALYWYAFSGFLETRHLPFLWWQDLALPLVYCAIAAAAFCAIPSIIYARLTGRPARSESLRLRLAQGLSMGGVFAAAGTELILIMLSNLRYADSVAGGQDYVEASGRLYALALLPFLTWGLIRLPCLVRFGGWKRLGIERFLFINMATSLLGAFGFHYRFGPDGLNFEWLFVMTAFGLVSGLAYILDCKLRADDRLAS